MDEKNIGTLARFMGVSPHTIKYYERIGILSSERDEKSNYRRYNIRICTELAECIKYRSMGFSLKELDVLKKTADSNQLNSMIEERVMKLETEIADMVQLRDTLKEFQNECHRAEADLNEWYVETWNQVIYCRMQTKNLTYTEENLAVGDVNVMDYAPRTIAVAVLDKEYMGGGEASFSWGQSISFSELQPLFERLPEFIKLSPKKVFITYRKYTGAFIANGTMAEDIKNIFHEYSPVFPNSVFAFSIKIVHDEEGNAWSYFKIVVPLK